MRNRKIRRALISVYYKDGILDIAKELCNTGVEILSTGGTYDFLAEHKIPVKAVEDFTSYPAILGGRVKTLHPKIFGGILCRREDVSDRAHTEEYDIPEIDLVVVNLYPFEEYLEAGAPQVQIIEKIDIGGISLIRAAAKNCRDVLVVPCRELYGELLSILRERGGETTSEERWRFAAHAFDVSSGYDAAIFGYFNETTKMPVFKKSISTHRSLRYGENPHQKALFFGTEGDIPVQLHGKEISYNNLLDVEAAIELISDFEEPTVAILKHNNACGCASRENVAEAWSAALMADPVSAYGGIIVTNRSVDKSSAEEMSKIFFEVVIAPSYDADALEIFRQKRDRIVLTNSKELRTEIKFRSMLGGVLVQERDSAVEIVENLVGATDKEATSSEKRDMIFANKLVKHSKSNAIVLAKENTLIASGIGQTSRIDALRQAIIKANNLGFSLEGAVMASDAFFPFADCVEVAYKAGITAVIQPGGSVRDRESIEFCNRNGITMVFTGTRHFKH